MKIIGFDQFKKQSQISCQAKLRGKDNGFKLK